MSRNDFLVVTKFIVKFIWKGKQRNTQLNAEGEESRRIYIA
jgi:hypothetical protein